MPVPFRAQVVTSPPPETAIIINQGGGAAFEAGGDLSGTNTDQTVSAIQGLPTPQAGLGTSAGNFMTVAYNPPWSVPFGIVSLGSNLWVSDQSASNIYKVTPSFLFTTVVTYPVPSALGKLITDGTNIFAAGLGFPPVAIISPLNGEVIGSGASSSPSFGLAIDGADNVWVVNFNSLVGYSIAAMLANPSTPQSPVGSLSIPAGPEDIASDGTYLYVSVAPNLVYKIDPTLPTPSIVGTYTAPTSINYLFWDATVTGGADLWVGSINTANIYRVDRTTMTHVVGGNISLASGPNANSAGPMAWNGTYIFAGASIGNAYVELIDPSTNLWFAEYAPTNPANQAHYMTSAPGGTIWAAEGSLTASFIQEYNNFGPFNNYIGPFKLAYTTLPPQPFVTLASAFIPSPPATGWTLFTNEFQSNQFQFLYQDSNTYLALDTQGPGTSTRLGTPNLTPFTLQAELGIGPKFVLDPLTGYITTTGGEVDTFTSLTGVAPVYAVVGTDREIISTATGGAEIDLPAATGTGRILKITNAVGNTTDTLNITPSGSDAIGANGAANQFFLTSVDSWIKIQDTAAGIWTILDRSMGNVWGPVSTDSIPYWMDELFIDTTAAGSHLATLSASPVIGETHKVYDATGFANSHNVQIAHNGNKINGSLADIYVTTSYGYGLAIWVGGTVGWYVFIGRTS
jgi:hypothetical protein